MIKEKLVVKLSFTLCDGMTEAVSLNACCSLQVLTTGQRTLKVVLPISVNC